ncbi:hypothetical protein DMC63_37910 [Streptomyces sp. WAC 05977]|nr:hypothetical protein DMC63_37910 [Streptomyces sp. WAC 05977]
MLLLGIRMGLSNLPQGTPEGFTDDERAVLARATFAEEGARKHFELSGEWPTTVRVDHDLAR